jgi:peptide/nickel transport system substrate-binding protein
MNEGMRMTDREHEGQLPGWESVTRRSMLRWAGAGIAGLSLGPLLEACGTAASAGGSSGGVVRLGYSLMVDTLNPFASVELSSQIVFAAIFPALTSQDAPSTPVRPNLASSWTVAPDGHTITFKVRTGGKWSDGRPITARDAAFTINTVAHYGSSAAAILALYALGVSHATAPDDETVVVTYSEPSAPALSEFAFLPILPEHVWGPLATGSGSRLTTFQVGQGAVCGGPFTLKRYTANEATLLEPNRGYYGPKPRAKAIGFEYLASDAAVIQALEGNTVDMIGTGLTASVPAGLKRLTAPTYKTALTTGTAFWDIGFNSNPHKPKNRELLDPGLRAALAHATDKERIISDVLFGNGHVGSSIMGPGMGEWYNPAIKPEGFDIDRANHMLDTLGYKRRGGGVRTANGQPMSYVMNVSTDEEGASQIFQIVESGWAQVGIHLTAKLLDTAAMVAATAGPNGKYLTDDVFMWSWQGQPDPQYVLGVLTAAQLGANSDTGFQNPEYDRLFDAQARELDHAKRVKLVYRLQEIAFHYKPYIVLCYPDSWVSVRASVQGSSLTADGPVVPSSPAWALKLAA